MIVHGSQEIRPLELDFLSSPTTLYYRKNIKPYDTTDEMGNVSKGWVYDEVTYPRTDDNIKMLTAQYATEHYAVDESIAKINETVTTNQSTNDMVSAELSMVIAQYQEQNDMALAELSIILGGLTSV